MEWLTNPGGPNQHFALGQYLDGAMSGGMDGLAAKVDVTGSTQTTTIYGLGDCAGQTLSVFSCGAYVGDFQVDASTGTITITETAATALVNPVGWADNETPDGDRWAFSSLKAYGSVNGTLTGGNGFIPMIVGTKFVSQSQILRPNSQQDAKTPTGSSIAKQRRFHMIGAHVQQTVDFNMAVGTEPYRAFLAPTGNNNYLTESFVYQLGTFKPVPVVYPNGSPYSGNLDFPNAKNNTGAAPSRPLAFNGILWSTVDDDYTFDGMIAWQVTDPYPCRVLSIGGFFQTQER